MINQQIINNLDDTSVNNGLVIFDKNNNFSTTTIIEDQITFDNSIECNYRYTATDSTWNDTFTTSAAPIDENTDIFDSGFYGRCYQIDYNYTKSTTENQYDLVFTFSAQNTDIQHTGLDVGELSYNILIQTKKNTEINWTTQKEYFNNERIKRAPGIIINNQDTAIEVPEDTSVRFAVECKVFGLDESGAEQIYELIGNQELQELEYAVITPILNFTYGEEADQILSGAIAHRISTNELLTGQIVANHKADKKPDYSSGPVKDTILFQKVGNNATSIDPHYDTLGGIDSNGFFIGEAPNETNNGLSTRLLEDKIISVTVDLVPPTSEHPTYGNPKMIFTRVGRNVDCDIIWIGDCKEDTIEGMADYEDYQAIIPEGYNPINNIYQSYICSENERILNNILGHWAFIKQSALNNIYVLKGNTNQAATAAERHAHISWITADAWPQSN